METVEVTLKLPKAIVDFLESCVCDPEEYMVHTLVEDVWAGLNGDAFNLAKQAVKRYELTPIFKDHNLSITGYIDSEQPDC